MKKIILLFKGITLGVFTLIVNFFITINIFENSLPSNAYHASMLPISLCTTGIFFTFNLLLYYFFHKKKILWLRAYLIASIILNCIFTLYTSTIHFYVGQ